MVKKITYPTGLHVEGDITLTGNLPLMARARHQQDTEQEYMIPWEAWRVWNAYGTNLPATPLTDDLGLVGGTFGTDSPSIQTEDLKAAGATTSYARACFQLPPEYDAGQTCKIRARGGMLTTVSDTTATVDFEVYESDDFAGIGSDLCTTAATTINSLTEANQDFTITETGLAAGDWLDIRMAVAVNDAATGTEVKAQIGLVALLLDIRG